MLLILRVIAIFIVFIFITTLATVACLCRPFHINNVHLISKYLRKVTHLMGLSVDVRVPDVCKDLGPVVYVANHQNSYDIFHMCSAMPKNTVTVGKKSLAWIPFFGPMYWLSGNILIDRKNTSRAMDTIRFTANHMKEKGLSVWLFAEGTRSNGNGFQPLKVGAFKTAVMAGVPIVPICLSNTHNRIKWNQWNNGKVIIEFLPPINIADDSKEALREAMATTQQLMQEKLNEISIESGSPYPEYKKIINKK